MLMLKIIWGIVMAVQFVSLCDGSVEFDTKPRERLFTIAYLATWVVGAILIAQV